MSTKYIWTNRMSILFEIRSQSSKSLHPLKMLFQAEFVLQIPALYWIIVALLCKLVTVMSQTEGKKLNLFLSTFSLSISFNVSSINKWAKNEQIISRTFIMEAFNIILRTCKALLWLTGLALSSVLVVPWCIFQSLLSNSSKDSRLQEIPQNEKRTVLLTGGPLTKGNIVCPKLFAWKWPA